MIMPVMKLGNTLLTSIHRHLTDEEASLFLDELLEVVRSSEPVGVVVDVSAMKVIDSFMSRILGQLSVGCRMMGAQPILCGIQPEVAITLLEMGRDFRGMSSATNLDHALTLLPEGRARPPATCPHCGRSIADGGAR